MISQVSVHELDNVACAAELRTLTETMRSAEARRLEVIAHWADLHSPSDESAAPALDEMREERFLTGRTDRVPAVSEFAAVELGCLIGVTTHTASKLMADALDLRADLPGMQSLVTRRLVEVWKARRVVTEIAQAHLDADDARRVDAEVSPLFATLPFGRAMTALEAACLAAKSSALAGERAEAAERRFVAVNRSTAPGMRTLVAQSTTADILRVNAMVGHLADLLLAHGDHRPADVRRAAALVLMANPGQACLLMARPVPHQHYPAHPDAEDPDLWVSGDAAQPDMLFDLDDVSAHSPCECAEARDADAIRLSRAVGEAIGAGTEDGQVPWDKLRPSSVLYLHMLHPCQQPIDTVPVIRPEFDGPATMDSVAEWLAHDRVILRPVWDTSGEIGVDAYEIPHRLREQMMLRHPYETFPYGTRQSRTCDLDHVGPYRPPPGDPGGAQTRSSNLRPLSRRHHRAKTHAAFHTQTYPRTVREETAATIGQLWRSPTGYWFKVDSHGTHDLDRPLAPSMEVACAEDLYVHLAS